MQAVSPADRHRIFDILCAAFDANKSVNFIAGAGPGRERRIRALMDYSFGICRRFGAVYLSDDRNACALVLHPEKKRFSAAALLADLRLILRCIGLRRLPAVLRREVRIKAQHPATPFTYLWFIGVMPGVQGQGRGSELLARIKGDSMQLHRPVYLETSAAANLDWYASNGFEIFSKLDTGFPVYCLRHSRGQP